jgi:hypothetical protein
MLIAPGWNKILAFIRMLVDLFLPERHSVHFQEYLTSLATIMTSDFLPWQKCEYFLVKLVIFRG